MSHPFIHLRIQEKAVRDRHLALKDTQKAIKQKENALQASQEELETKKAKVQYLQEKLALQQPLSRETAHTNSSINNSHH